MGLPFKSNNNPIKQVTIHDGYGSSIDIPSRGYVDAKEYSEAMKLIINASEDNRLHTVERDIVVMLLISRFNLPLNTSPEQLLKFEDGSSIGAPMLKALYNHFVVELGADADVIKFPLGNYPNFTQSEIVNVTTVSDVQNNSKRTTKQTVEV